MYHIVFINFTGDAPPLEDFLAPMIEFYGDHDFSTVTMAFDSEDGDGLHRFPAKANWKLLWENYAPDVYHENFVHLQYRKSDHVPRVDGRGGKTFTEVDDRGFMGLAFDTAAVGGTYPAVELPKNAGLQEVGRWHCWQRREKPWLTWGGSVVGAPGLHA